MGQVDARAIYDRFRSEGLSVYQAIHKTQGHNREAQKRLEEYGPERTETYAESLDIKL